MNRCQSDLVPTWFPLGSLTQFHLVPTPKGVGEPGTKSETVRGNRVRNRVEGTESVSSQESGCP